MIEMRQTQDQILDLAKRYGSERVTLAHKQEIQNQLDSKEKQKLKDELMHLTRKYNDEMKSLNTNVSFSYSDEIEGLRVVVKEGDSEKVIREIPSKEAIELMKKMQDLVGAIFDKRG